MMPELDGLTIAGRLRLEDETRSVPIIMLTARTDEVDCVLGLEMGVDDYLKKPFSVKELIARVKAMIRRKEYTSPVDVKNETLAFGNLEINVANHTVTKNGKIVNLTLKEFELLVNLIRERNKVMTREQLMSRVWSPNFTGDARTVDVHVRYLRQKIEDKPENPMFVKTVRGIGYRMASPEELANN
jgi:two-component system alkaline phosphatase synthesis response regulator PhoP